MSKLRSLNNQNFYQLLERIEELFPLTYNSEINQLFKKLQEELDRLTDYDVFLIKRLNSIWAERGFSMERHFALQQNIQSFDFYPKYKKLLHFDSLRIKKSIKESFYSKVIFVGSGPLPLSLKLLRLNIQKVGYDISSQAIKLSKKSIPKDRFGRKIIYQKADFFNLNISESRPVIVYIAGLIQGKKEGVARLIKQLPKKSLIIVRTVANDKRNLLYERLNKNDFFKFGVVKEFNPTKSSGIVNGMIIIKVSKK